MNFVFVFSSANVNDGDVWRFCLFLNSAFFILLWMRCDCLLDIRHHIYRGWTVHVFDPEYVRIHCENGMTGSCGDDRHMNTINLNEPREDEREEERKKINIYDDCPLSSVQCPVSSRQSITFACCPRAELRQFNAAAVDVEQLLFTIKMKYERRKWHERKNARVEADERWRWIGCADLVAYSYFYLWALSCQGVCTATRKWKPRCWHSSMATATGQNISINTIFMRPCDRRRYTQRPTSNDVIKTNKRVNTNQFSTQFTIVFMRPTFGVRIYIFHSLTQYLYGVQSMSI